MEITILVIFEIISSKLSKKKKKKIEQFILALLCGGKELKCSILIQKIAQRGAALYSKCHEKINYHAGCTSSRETQ